jgi:hypothetical protein
MAPAIDEARAVEEIVRRFFVGGDDVDGVALTAGPLRDVAALFGQLRLPSRRTGIELRRLATTALVNGAAEVDLLAIERWEALEKGHGRRRWTVRFTGPVRLRRVEDDWRIVDYRLDGRWITESCRVVEAEPRERRGIRFRPRGVFLHRRATMAFFELENGRTSELELRAASSSSCYCTPKPASVAPGERVVALVSWPKRTSLRRMRIRGRLLARDRASGEGFDFGWLVDRAAGTGSATVSRRPSLVLRLYAVLGDTGFLAALVLLPPLVTWLTLGGRSAHGIFPYSAGTCFFAVLSMLGHGRWARAAAFALAALGFLELWSLTGR